MLSNLFSQQAPYTKRRFGKKRGVPGTHRHRSRKSKRNFSQRNHTKRNSTPSKNVFDFYSNPGEKKMKWIDFVKQIHNKNRERDNSTPLSKSLKDASKLWKKR